MPSSMDVSPPHRSPVWLVANPSSGSFDEAAYERLLAALAGVGMEPDRIFRFPADDLPSSADLDRNGIGIVAVFAGDGTINTLILRLAGWGGQVLVLPGGTMNLLARRLHGSADACEIVERVGAGKGHAMRLPVARCRQGDALAGFMAGPATVWSDVREAMRQSNLFAFANGVADAIGESLGGETVLLAEPAGGRAEGYPLLMATPTREGLVVDGFFAESAGDIAAHAVALAQRDFRAGPSERLGIFARIELVSRDGSAPQLLLDGEPATGDLRQVVEHRPCGVDLVATDPQEIA